MTTSVLLVRHAQSTGNAERMWQGLIDAPLSELGEAQARAAAAAVGGVDAIVASSMERAWRTAEIIAETLGVGPVIRIPELRERDLGAWTGLTTREITTRWPASRKLSAIVRPRSVSPPVTSTSIAMTSC